MNHLSIRCAITYWSVHQRLKHMTPSIGEKIIAAIACGPLVRITNADRNGYDNDAVFVWTQSAAEQLEAVVEAHIEEEVRKRVYIEMSVKKSLSDVEDHLDDKSRKTIQDYIDKKYPDVAPPYPSD